MKMDASVVDVSVVIVSFNTRALLRECLDSVYQQEGVTKEVLVVDNASGDGSAELLRAEYPQVRLTVSETNLGFAGANNVAFAQAQGRYVVLLNSDAFLEEDTLRRAVADMDREPAVGLAGGLLVGRDRSWQPSARLFPSPLNDLLSLTGLSSRFSRSRIFGRVDRTWADPNQPAETDWVPGAFSIIRRDVLESVGYFDERFFLYYEEVDLCRRMKRAGFKIAYWPHLIVTHLGGESSKNVKRLSLSSSGTQLTLWRMRSQLLYYRKHHGWRAWLSMAIETNWHRLRLWNQARRAGEIAWAKRDESLAVIHLFERAWNETSGGRSCPTRPW
jgi:GT2 family glycosyltransferase